MPAIHGRLTGLLTGCAQISAFYTKRDPPVATRMERSPALNLLSAPRRLGWLICPWMGSASKPRLRSCSASRRAASQVRVNTMNVAPASSVRKYAR